MLIFTLGGLAAQADVFVWKNPAGGYWNEPSNWLNNAVPSDGHDVVITTNGTYTVTLNTSATPKSLTLGGATGTQSLVIVTHPLNLPNSGSIVNPQGKISLKGSSLTGVGLNVAGVLDWSAGSLYGALSIPTNGTLDISVSGYTGFVSHYGAITNAGLIKWTGAGYVRLFDDARIHNLTNGLIDVQAFSTYGFYYGGGSPAIINDGVFRKSGGGAADFPFASVPIINRGTLDAQVGRVVYAGGSVFHDGTVFSGAGTNLLNTGTVTMDGNIYSSNMLLAGNVTVTGGWSLIGAATWSDGYLYGALSIPTNGTLDLSVSGYTGFVRHYGAITNAGLIKWTGAGYMRLFDDAVIHNLSNGLIDVQAHSTYGFYIGNGSPVIVNDGVFRKSGGGMVNFPFSVPIINHGVLDVQVGRVVYADGSIFHDGTVFSGAGTNLLNTGTVTMDGNIYSSNMLMAGNVTVTGGWSLIGAATWSDGYLYGALSISTNGTLEISAGNPIDPVLHYGAITNAGLIKWTGAGYIRLHDDAVIHNLSNGLIDVQTDSTYGFDRQNGSPLIVNDGVFRKSGGGAVNFPFDSVPLFNRGLLDVQVGRVVYAGGSVFHDGTVFSGAGTNLLNTGPVTMDGNIYSSNMIMQGNVTITGAWSLIGAATWSGGSLDGALSIPTNGTLDISTSASVRHYGAITNAGLVNWTGAGYMGMYGAKIHNLTNGLIDVQSDSTWGFSFQSGSPLIVNDGEFRRSGKNGVFPVASGVLFSNSGSVNVQDGSFRFSTFNQSPSGRMNFGIGSQTDFGRIAFTGVAPLDGMIGANLNNGYVPTSTTAFVVMTYSSHAGLFADTDLPDQYVAWQTNMAQIVGATKATLSILNVRPAIDVIANQTLDELADVTFAVTANDSDAPPQTLAWSLGNAPAGATLGSASGIFDWTPSEGQGPSTNIIQIIATDNGVPVLSATNTFTAVVNEVNVAPVLSSLANFTVNPGQTISFTAIATDADIPANTLTFSLLGPPSGAAISGAGAFDWRPTMAQANATNIVQVQVTDNNPAAVNSQHLSDTNSFTVVVNPLAPVVLTSLVYTNGNFTFTVTGPPGPDYIISASTNLTQWSDLSTNLTPTTPFQYSDTNAPSLNKRFYRAVLAP